MNDNIMIIKDINIMNYDLCNGVLYFSHTKQYAKQVEQK